MSKLSVLITVKNFKLYRSDPHNWCVEKKRVIQKGDNKGKEVWGDKKSFPKLQQAIQFLFENLSAETESDNLDELVDIATLIDAVNHAEKAILDVLKSTELK